MKKSVYLMMAIAILVLTACGPTSNQAPAAPAAPTSAPAVAATEAPAAAPTEAPAVKPTEPAAAAPAEASAAKEDCSTMPAPKLMDTVLKPTAKSTPITIAYVPNVMNTHYQMVLNGIKEQIERYGGEKFAKLLLQVPTSNTTSIKEQGDILENMVQQKVDVILLATESEEAEMPYMKAAAEAGIPVFLFNMAELRPDDPYYVSMIGYDQKNAGYLIGEWAVKHFGDKPTKVAILEGFPGVVNSMRLDGFKCAIEGKSNFNIVASQVADWTRAQGQAVAENILTANPDINFMFGLYDEMSLGAITAIKERKLLDQIAVAGYDNTKDANASIKAGEMMVTVDTAAKEMGINLIKSVKTFVVDNKPVDRIVNSKLVVYDQSNIGTFDEENYIYVTRQPE
ncbi:MAG: sugar ABC transporter substrate-binding protein [Leptolinea sp.]|jgi:ribose transport system substrate-binding protein|nr:sugar ABC transporter substrate-binding protein [Leptolinea sp.]